MVEGDWGLHPLSQMLLCSGNMNTWMRLDTDYGMLNIKKREHPGGQVAAMLSA